MLTRFKSSIVPLTIAVSLLIFTSAALAIDYGKPSTTPARSSQASTAGMLRACQARESAVKNRMNHLVELATNMMNKFDKHAQRVEKYYTDKVLPTGKTVSNYDSLVSDISTKKIAVQNALTKAQNDINGFNCASGDPKALMTQFRQDMQATKKALKDFRTSIKNLIVAVHSVTSTEATQSGKENE